MLEGESTEPELVAIMGLYQMQSQVKVQVNSPNTISQEEETAALHPGGRIIVYGDSNCLDNSHMQKGSLFFAMENDAI